METNKIFSSNVAFKGWSTWSDWSDCDDNGERLRTRKCLKTNPDVDECQGNERDTRACNPIMSNGSYKMKLKTFHRIRNLTDFFSNFAEVIQTAGNTSIYLLLFLIVMLACSNVLIYLHMKKRHAPRDIKSIGSPCFDSFPNQYSSLPTKEDRPKIKRHSSFSSNGLNGSNTNGKLLSNGHGTLTKTNNVTGCHTPKVLAKSFVEIDTATIKRNSHALNNSRPLRTIEDDKF